MELNKGTYYGIYKDKAVKIEVLKKNKKSYAVVIDGDKETLWKDSSGFYVKGYEAFRMSTYPRHFPVEIVTFKEANIFKIKKNIDICQYSVKHLSEQKEIKTKELEEIQGKINTYDEKIKLYESKLKELEADVE